VSDRLEELVPVVGARIAGYELVEEVGRGGFGVVFRARQLGLGADVAVKVLLPALMGDSRADELVARFRQEADSAKLLEHPVAIKVRDFGKTASGLPFLVTEYVRGSSLERVLAEGPLSEVRVVRLADQLLGCLAEAHHLGIVHRDLKPSNIMLRDIYGEADVVKILDFGVAKMSQDLGGLKSQTGLGMGTPHYMAPEQARGFRDLDGRADLYALGLVMAECLTGERVVQADSLMAVLYAHAGPEPHELAPAVRASALFPIIERATAKDRDLRFRDAVAMRQALWAVQAPAYRPGASEGPSPRCTPTPPRVVLGPDTPSPTGVTVRAELARASVSRGLVGLVLALLLAGTGVIWGLAREGSPTLPNPEPSRSVDQEAPSPETLTETVGQARTSALGAVARAEAWTRASGLVRRAVPTVRGVEIGGDEGVTVSLGGSTLCETPCVLAAPVVPGTVTLEVSRAGYRDDRIELELAEGHGVEVSLRRERRSSERRSGEARPEPPEPAVEAPVDDPFGGVVW
jgi:serine/threonine protein kinase